MSRFDSGTDLDSNFGIPGNLTPGSGSAGGSSFVEARPESPLPDSADAPVGLSDPQYVSQRRRMLDTVNRLRATG
jgi:hypothetical protein